MKQESFARAVELRRSLARLNRRLRLEARETGLSVAKHSVLGHLYRDGARTPSALAAADGVQPQSMTRVLAELEEAGLALRRQDVADRRQFQLEITPEGRELVEREAKSRAVWLAGAMDLCLSEVEQEVLRLAAQLMDRVVEGGGLNGVD